jgi:type I restriction enzyme S subunit
MIGRYGASVGQILRGKSGAYNVALIKTIPNEKLIDREFFYLYLISDLFQSDLLSVADRSAQAGFSKPDIARFEVPLPPLSEQKRIVAILDEAFEWISTAVAKTEKNLANARELFESYLNSLFTLLGEEWVEKPIAQIATKIGSGATPRGGQESYKSEGIPLIRSLNVHDRKFKYDDLAFLGDEQAEKLDNVIVQKGDVLLNITGASVARCCQVPDDVLPARVNQHVSIIRPIQSIVSPQFLEYALTARPNKDRLLGVGEKGGSTRQAITKAEIQEFRLAYPPLDAQAAIASRLDKLSGETSRLEAIYQRKLESLAELKQAILQKAFAGKLAAQPKQFLREAVA